MVQKQTFDKLSDIIRGIEGLTRMINGEVEEGILYTRLQARRDRAQLSDEAKKIIRKIWEREIDAQAITWEFKEVQKVFKGISLLKLHELGVVELFGSPNNQVCKP